MQGLGVSRLRGLGVGRDVPGEVRSVVVNETEQRRATGVLPRQSEEVQPGDPGDAALVNHLAVADHARDADPGVVGAEAGSPDDDAGLQRGSVPETGGAPVCTGQPRPEPDPRGF